MSTREDRFQKALEEAVGHLVPRISAEEQAANRARLNESMAKAHAHDAAIKEFTKRGDMKAVALLTDLFNIEIARKLS